MAFFDMHTHSCRSNDAGEPVAALCAAAVRAGLAGLAITDHLDAGVQLEPDWAQRLEGSLLDARAAAGLFRGQIDVLCGVELGQPMQDVPLAERVLTEYSFDVVSAGVHNPPGGADYHNQKFDAQNVNALLAEYADELLRTARWGGYDVLAHIGYPLRYVTGAAEAALDRGAFERALDPVIAAVAGAGKALELNMAGPGRGTGEATASVEQLRRFRELGGLYVTIGSDAHAGRYVGACFDEAAAMLRAAGFAHVAHYRARRPVLTPL